MNFESSQFEGSSNERGNVPVWETPEALEAKIEESVAEIMNIEDAGEVEQMAIAEKIAETFPEESRKKLIDRVAEEIEKRKESGRSQNREAAETLKGFMGIAGQESHGKTRKGEHEWRKQHDA